MPAKIVKPLCFLFRQPRRASSCSKPGPRIMPTLPENLSDYVRRTLAKKGVEVTTPTFTRPARSCSASSHRAAGEATTPAGLRKIAAGPAFTFRYSFGCRMRG
jgi:hypothetical protein